MKTYGEERWVRVTEDYEEAIIGVWEGQVTRDLGDNSNGELCYYSFSRTSPWNALEIYARKLTHYERTEDVNLSQQMTPFIGIAPQDKRLELVNLLKQVQGGEPAIYLAPRSATDHPAGPDPCQDPGLVHAGI